MPPLPVCHPDPVFWEKDLLICVVEIFFDKLQILWIIMLFFRGLDLDGDHLFLVMNDELLIINEKRYCFLCVKLSVITRNL